MDYNQNQRFDNREKHMYVQAAPASGPRKTSSKTNAFAVASMICGICSVLFCCIELFSIVLGALGILFFILSMYKDKKLSPHSLAFSISGIILSSIGLILGLLMMTYLAITYINYHDIDYRDFPNYQEDYFDPFYHDDHYGDDDYDDYYHNDYYHDDYYDDDYYDYYRDFYDDYYRDFYDDFYDYGFEHL